MTQQTFDIFISGGGVAGLIAAVAFGDAGFSVLCVEPNSPITDREAKGADLRTTAYLQPSREFLETIGIWSLVKQDSMPLDVMRILETGNENTTARDFKSSELSDQPFGHNVGNWAMRAGLLKRLVELPNVNFITGVETQKVFSRTNSAHITLSDKKQVTAKLVIAADGRNSPIRTAAGIDVTRTDFGQSALTFGVTHPIPHQNISTEVHKDGGPFTLVPLPDFNGIPCSAVVWMEHNEKAKSLLALDDQSFECAATDRSSNVLGTLTLVGRRTLWPIISQIAGSFQTERTALIAEAAHVVPPIGAQGLNMSLADIQKLLELAKAAPAQIGSSEMLEQYHRSRHFDVKARMLGVGTLNRFSMTGAPILQNIRAKGLEIIHDVPAIRKTLMRLGLGIR